MRERYVATLNKQRFDKDEHGHGSYKRGESGDIKHDDATTDRTPVPSIKSTTDADAHTTDGKLPGYPHGTAASGTNHFTVLDDHGNEVAHSNSYKKRKLPVRIARRRRGGRPTCGTTLATQAMRTPAYL